MGKKAIGVDKTPPKLVKAGAAQLSEPLATLLNMSVTQAVFPCMLKGMRLYLCLRKGMQQVKLTIDLQAYCLV